MESEDIESFQSYTKEESIDIDENQSKLQESVFMDKK